MSLLNRAFEGAYPLQRLRTFECVLVDNNDNEIQSLFTAAPSSLSLQVLAVQLIDCMQAKLNGQKKERDDDSSNNNNSKRVERLSKARTTVFLVVPQKKEAAVNHIDNNNSNSSNNNSNTEESDMKEEKQYSTARDYIINDLDCSLEQFLKEYNIGHDFFFVLKKQHVTERSVFFKSGYDHAVRRLAEMAEHESSFIAPNHNYNYNYNNKNKWDTGFEKGWGKNNWILCNFLDQTFLRQTFGKR